VLAAKAATTTIPIVFLTAGDPIHEGFVASLNRPGGNLTGINWFGAQVGAKALGLLHEIVPYADVIGLLVLHASTANEIHPLPADANRSSRSRRVMLSLQGTQPVSLSQKAG